MQHANPDGVQYHKTTRKRTHEAVKKAFALLLLVGALKLGLQYLERPLTITGQEQTGKECGRLCDEKLDAMDSLFNSRRNVRSSAGIPGVGKNFFDAFEPEAVCFFEERFGEAPEKKRYEAFGDGPKFVCGVDYLNARKSEKNSCLVYSVGSNNNFKFEDSVKKYLKGCEIHTFDPTLRYADFNGHHVTIYHEWGLGEDGKLATLQNVETTLKSLKTIMRDLGHTNRTIDIFKIDCEGCEWEVFPEIFDAIAQGKLSINQIQVELHSEEWKFKKHDIYGFFSKADKAGLRIFHKERNHWGCDGYMCVEYSLVSEAWLREVNKQIIC